MKKDTAISVNKYIYTLLNGDDELKRKVTSINVMIAEENTQFPFIVFKRNSIDTNYSKDGKVNDTASIQVNIVSKNYAESVEIAERVRGIIELHRDDYFKRITLSSVNEEYADDSYVQQLNFNVIL